MSRIILRRSLLFVPGNNERMLRKALSPKIECDCVIFDLEDSVPLDQKDQARKTILNVLEESKSNLSKRDKKKEISLRINQLENPLSRLDIGIFSKKEIVSSFVVPKAEPKGIRSLSGKSGKRIIPLVESATGFHSVEDLARTKGVDGIAYGAADMALSMRGSVETFQISEYIRTKLAIVARAYGLDPIDQVYFDLNNIEGFRNDARKAKSIGYAGKMLIHPSQVKIANEVFSNWAASDKDWAKRVIEAYEESTKRGTKGALRLDGQLIDTVHYKLAKDILGIAG